jgi:hypothetical protein
MGLTSVAGRQLEIAEEVALDGLVLVRTTRPLRRPIAPVSHARRNYTP